MVALTSHRSPVLWHALLLSTRCFRIPLSLSRISGRRPTVPHGLPTSTLPVKPRSRARFPIFPLKVWEQDATQDELGSSRPPPGVRSPGGRVLELESERLLDDAVVHLQQDHGGGCPGQGKEKQER